jgi:hypothetical protein
MTVANLILRPDILYIFKENIDGFWAWKRKHSNILGIWWDGDSEILNGVVELSKPSHIIIEEVLFDTLSKMFDTSSFSKLSVQSGQKSANIGRSNLREQPIALFASNDTHVQLFEPVLDHFDQYHFVISQLINEGAKETLTDSHIPFTELRYVLKDRENFGLLLSGNDWGPVERYTHRSFQNTDVPTVCLQESVIDFQDSYARMEWCNFPLIQGIATVPRLQREIMFLTGNPRYTDLSPCALPPVFRVLINSNFTYGIYEDIRKIWIEDVISVCEDMGLEYLIAQHPRDRGNLAKFNTIPSNPRVIHNLLRDSSVLVTRFSSLIHESIALGRPVLYYNPHNENMNYQFEFDGSHLALAMRKKELAESLERIVSADPNDPQKDSYYYLYGMRHFGSADGKASERVAQALQVIKSSTRFPKPRSSSIIQTSLNYRRLELVQMKKRLSQKVKRLA